MAMVIMGANIAGIYGAQIFRQDDRPKYRRGFSIACAVLAVGLTLAIFRFIDDQWRKRKNRKDSPRQSSKSDVERVYEEPKALPASEVQPAPIIIDAARNPSISKTVS
jgi:TRAP-type C4-dicarboxylate transport system permease small subunit